MSKFDLVRKTETYYDDILKTGERIPFPRFAAGLAALWSYVIWGTSFSEYYGYRFWKRSIKEKRSYMTRRHMFRFFDQYNPKELRDRIGNKALAEQYYGQFLKRDQFRYEQGHDAFLEFARRHPRVFLKKAVGWGGEGARVEDIASPEQAEAVWASLDQTFVVEPLLENHPAIREIHPASLNTVKIVTLYLTNGPEIQTALIRFGNNTEVDNVHSGGMGAGVNIETGLIETEAVDKHFQRYSAHPVTGKVIKGFVVPEWESVKQLALQAATVTPELRYASWDIAVTPDGPILIEGNWDAEFYAEQMLYNRGNRSLFVNKLEGNTYD